MSRRRQSSSQQFATYRAHGAASLEPDAQDASDRLRRDRTRSFPALLGELWRLLYGRRRVLVVALGLLSLATVVGLAMPASTKIVIDYVLTDNPGPAGVPDWLGLPQDRMGLLWLVAGAMAAAATVSAGLGLWGRWIVTRLRMRVQAGLRRRAFEHAVRLPLHRLQSLKSGGAASLLRDDAGGAGDLLFSILYNPWRAVLQLIGTLAILAVVDWRLLVGSLVLFPVIWHTHRTWISRIRPVYRDIRRTRQRIDAQATEVFGGMRVVRAFNRERSEARRYTTFTHLMLRQDLLAWWRARAVNIAWQLLIPLASAGVLLYGGWQVIQGALTIGDVMMFSTYLLMLLSPLETLAATATSIQNNLAGFDRTLDLLDEPTERHAQRDHIHADPAEIRGEISLDDVSFRYPGASEDAPPTLAGVDLRVTPGEIVALVGHSGAGKTTLCNLIARFYDPTAGAIRLDGVDLRDIELDSYRRLLGVVEQDVFLFDGTVEENIAFARPDAVRDEVETAARAACAHDFIREFPAGYETLIGERGVRLSGGQRQRLAIARALLADPRILILDEATSNLDAASERLLQQSMFRLMEGRTCFVIAHRLSTIRHADRIVVMEGGRIVEVGAHDELLHDGGRYAALLRAQLVDSAEGHGSPSPIEARPGV